MNELGWFLLIDLGCCLALVAVLAAFTPQSRGSDSAPRTGSRA